MRRWLLRDGVTEIDGLEIQDVPLPQPGPGQVRVRVHVVSLNARDRLILRGGAVWRTPGADIIPTSDMSGVIDALGEGVSDWAVGDRVVNLFFDNWIDGAPKQDPGMGLGATTENGVLADHVVLPQTRIARAPLTLSHEEAATLPCAGVTAWNMLFEAFPVTAGDQVLITGAGGVSIIAAQLALAAGGRVCAISGSDDKLSRLRDMGVEPGLNHRTTSAWGAEIARLTGGVQKVVNTVGAAFVNEGLGALAYGGEVALAGLYEQQAAPLDWRIFGHSLRGVTTGSASMYAALADFVDAHGVKPVIHRSFPMEEARAAYHAQGAADLFGKIVITLV